ncbi:hypothetical protein C2E23DRAFT_439977 [Lenzites betulinus]|nr:hypothetical protein C2E23DRAFT_439977 [Lenzites betulinus]
MPHTLDVVYVDCGTERSSQRRASIGRQTSEHNLCQGHFLIRLARVFRTASATSSAPRRRSESSVFLHDTTIHTRRYNTDTALSDLMNGGDIYGLVYPTMSQLDTLRGFSEYFRADGPSAASHAGAATHAQRVRPWLLHGTARRTRDEKRPLACHQWGKLPDFVWLPLLLRLLRVDRGPSSAGMRIQVSQSAVREYRVGSPASAECLHPEK